MMYDQYVSMLLVAFLGGHADECRRAAGANGPANYALGWRRRK